MIRFNTAYHLPEGTTPDLIQVVTVEVNDEHTTEAKAALLVGAPVLSNMVRIGLQEGWITVVN